MNVEWWLYNINWYCVQLHMLSLPMNGTFIHNQTC